MSICKSPAVAAQIITPAPALQAESHPPKVQVSRLDLLAAFLKIGLMGFGGVAPYARRVIVEERQWFPDEDYTAILGFGQILPGANTINAAVIIEDRFEGAFGSVIAV